MTPVTIMMTFQGILRMASVSSAARASVRRMAPANAPMPTLSFSDDRQDERSNHAKRQPVAQLESFALSSPSGSAPTPTTASA